MSVEHDALKLKLMQQTLSNDERMILLKISEIYTALENMKLELNQIKNEFVHTNNLIDQIQHTVKGSLG